MLAVLVLSRVPRVLALRICFRCLGHPGRRSGGPCSRPVLLVMPMTIGPSSMFRVISGARTFQSEMSAKSRMTCSELQIRPALCGCRACPISIDFMSLSCRVLPHTFPPCQYPSQLNLTHSSPQLHQPATRCLAKTSSTFPLVPTNV